MKSVLAISLLGLLLLGCSCTCGTESVTTFAPPDVIEPTPEATAPPQEAESEVEPLVISDVRVTNIKFDSAVVRWETNRPATSVVKYRIGRWSAQAVYSVEDIWHIKSHRVKLKNLRAGTTYAIYSITCTGSETIEYRGLVLFNTPYPEGFWSGIGGIGGVFLGGGSPDTVTISYIGGDGSWDSNTQTWAVSAYPAESKTCKFSIHNGKGYTITLYLDAAFISYPIGGETEGSLSADSVTIPSGGSANIWVVASFTQSAPIGKYVWTFCFNGCPAGGIPSGDGLCKHVQG